jgi:hypothetical protein
VGAAVTVEQISVALNKIDAAVLAVQTLTQETLGQEQLRELRRISRTLAQQEAALVQVFK